MKTIVAEVSKSWGAGTHSTLGERFEAVIAVNSKRGYTLKDCRFNQIIQHDGSLSETIIAVFVFDSSTEIEKP